MKPPFRSVVGAAAGCSTALSALVFVLDVSMVVLLVRLIPVFAYIDAASPKRTHNHLGTRGLARYLW
jgi:hypothetical protein